MGAAPSEYDAVIADLENQVIEIQNTIETLKRVRDKMGAPGLAATAVTVATPSEQRRVATDTRITPGTGALAISNDTFFGMSIVDGVKKYLGMVRKPQDTRTIVAALERGGFTHTSKNFYGTIFSVLRRRATNEGDIVKVTSGLWALADWYPALRRKGGAPKRDEEISEFDAISQTRGKPSEEEPRSE